MPAREKVYRGLRLPALRVLLILNGHGGLSQNA
jgi:creatinine amidohydrolase/Fe(II)-dependent formamide hydrolase-like protein